MTVIRGRHNRCDVPAGSTWIRRGQETMIATSRSAVVWRALRSRQRNVLSDGMVRQLRSGLERLAGNRAIARRIALGMEEFAEPQCFATDPFRESVRRLLHER